MTNRLGISTHSVHARLVFDTNVCGKLAISPHCHSILRCLNANYRIAASANTVLELLLGICRSTSEDYFVRDKERFRAAVGSRTLGSAGVLDYPLTFALRCAHIQRPEDSGGLRRLRDYVKAVLMARTLRELKVTGVTFPGSQHRRTLNCELVEENIRFGKKLYSGPLNHAKMNDIPLATPLEWAANLGRFYAVPLHDQQAEGLASALDAAYEYQKWVWTKSLASSFRPENDENDWIDMNQLFYLADPATTFVTEDRKIRERCANSRQASRILLLKELLDQYDLAL